MASSPHDHSLNALPPGAVVGDYTIESELGSGGFSIVYLARHHMSGDEPDRIWRAAIKEYLPAEVAGRDRDGLTVRPSRSDRQEAFDDGLRRFKEEALHLVRFQRLGNVVDCLNLFEANGTAYLVMEYDDGLPLSAFLQLREEQGRPCSENDLMAVMVPLLKCLSEVHRARVYHRDIKPGNIFVRRADDVLGRPAEPMLLDFGAAKLDYLATHSRSGAPYTPGYAPLEQTSSIGEMGPWTDIYALGATMWRMVAGGGGDSRLNAPEDSVDPPPGTRNPTPVDAQKRLAAMNWRPPRPDPMPSAEDLGAGRFPPHVLEAIDRCLSLYPEDRPKNCEELLGLLGGAADSGTAESDVGHGVADAAGDTEGEAPRPSPAAVAFTVETKPPEAAVEFLSIDERYRPGMSLLPGRYRVEASAPGRESRRVWLEHRSGARHEIVLEKVAWAFTVETGPPGAAVRILNIAARYAPGMRLAAGDYRVEVSAPGYETVEESVGHGGAPTKRRIDLKKRGWQSGDVIVDTLRSGGVGPEMVVIPAGRFRMGCLSNDDACFSDEKPDHEVTIARAFALGVREVTFAQWDACVEGGGCGGHRPEDEGWGRGDRPVINVSWEDAQSYVTWLSRETGESYRLPSESEWEYAARAGTATKYSWGNEIGVNRANCDGCGSRWDNQRTAPVGSFAPNGFGLYDMHGNVWEWVEDCWNGSYAGAPSDGGAWRSGDCAKRVLRGGSWGGNPRDLRAAGRFRSSAGIRFISLGFRVARTLTP